MVAFNDLNRITKRIRREVCIVEVVGEFLDVDKHGRSYVARCPWHEDSRPSLQVNPERNAWSCWVCDEWGESIAFLMKYLKIDFRTAVQRLAQRLTDD